RLLADDARVRRALLGGDPLAVDVLDALDRAALLHEELGAGHEERDGEVHALPPGPRVRHRARDEIHRVRREKRDAGGRRGFLLLDLDGLAHLPLDRRLHQLVDEIDGEADPLVLRVDVREGRRAGAGADGEHAGLADLLEGAGQLLRGYRYDSGGEQGNGGEQSDDTLHAGPP